MTDHGALRDSLRNTLEALKRRRDGVSHGWESNEKELRAIYEKKERLGLIYADDPKALINTGVFFMGEYGSSMEIVDGDAQSNLEVPK